MPRVWGSQVTASGGAKFRLGMDYSVSGTKITVSGYIVEFQGYFINASSVRLTRTGKLSGSVTFPFRLNGNGTISIPSSGGSFTGTRGSSYTFGGKMDQLPFAGLSASVSTTVKIPTGLPTAPGRPSATNITRTGVRIGWDSPSSNGGSSVTSYQLQRFRGSSTGGTLESTTSHTVAVNVTGLTPNTQYTFRVRARNANGYGPYSATRTIRTNKVVVPTAPGRPSATSITPVSVRLSWSAPSSNGGASVTSYQLQRYKGASASGTPEAATTHTGAVTVTGLSPGTQYTFRVRARNSAGYGPYSTTRTIRTKNVVWVRVSGVWRQAIPYVKHNGAWKEAIAMVRHNGKWRSTG